MGLLLWVYLGEVLWLLLADHDGVRRVIHGSNLLRVSLASLVGSVSYSRNLFGWLQDLDKIAPWTVTILVYVLFGSILRSVAKNGILSPRRLSPLVSGAGLAGGALIFLHFIESSSGHWASYQDKGLLDAVGHLIAPAAGDDSGAWVGILLYRIHYLTLTPYMYWVLFTTVAGCAWLSWQLMERAAGATTDRMRALAVRYAVRALLLGGVPLPFFALLYGVCARPFGMGNFTINTWERAVLLASLYAMFVGASVALIGRWLRPQQAIPMRTILREQVRGDLRSLNALIKRFIRPPVMAVAWIVLAVGGPYGVLSDRVMSRPLNEAINQSWHFYVRDYSHLPRSAATFDEIVREVVCERPEREVLRERFSPEWNENAAALGLAVSTLLRIGVSPEEIANVDDDRDHWAELFRKHQPTMLQRFPVFQHDEHSKKDLEKCFYKELQAYRMSVRKAGWRYAATVDTVRAFVESVKCSPSLGNTWDCE